MNRSFYIFILMASLIFLPQGSIFYASYSSASGHTTLSPRDWWYYPMIVEEGERVTGNFGTDGPPVQWFIIHEINYLENMTVDTILTLENGYGASGSFDFIASMEGGWFWVFVNLASIDVRVDFEWEANISLATLALDLGFVAFVTLIVAFGGLWYFKKWKKKISNV